MKEVKEYAELFETGQYGRFFITSDSTLIGEIFFIQILPENEDAITQTIDTRCINPNAVTVYGVIDNIGMDNVFGWIYHGKWQADFQKLVADRRKEIAKEKKEREDKVKANEQREKQRIKKLLQDYDKDYNGESNNDNNGNHRGNNKNK